MKRSPRSDELVRTLGSNVVIIDLEHPYAYQSPREADFHMFLEKHFPGEWIWVGGDAAKCRFGEMGYVPDFVHRTENIFLEYEWQRNASFTHHYNRKNKVYREAGYKLLVICSRGNPTLSKRMIECIRGRKYWTGEENYQKDS